MDPVIICKILGRDSFKIIIVVKDRIILHNAEYCLVGKNIHAVLDDMLTRVQKALEAELASITLEDIMQNTRELI